MNVIRPADGNETRVAWEAALESESTPTEAAQLQRNLFVPEVITVCI